MNGDPQPAPVEEHDGDPRALDVAALIARERPLVIRGLVREWPLVRRAVESDSAFAADLAALDSGVPVDALRLPPSAGGVIGYTPAMDGFNYEHYRVSLTQGLHRLAAYSRRDDAPGLAIQSAPVDACIPGFRREHSLPLLDPAVAPRLWVGNRITTPVHFDAQHNVACVVCGRRRFTLFPPGQLPNLYIGPLDFAPTGAAIGTARLDRPDDPRFPRLRDALAAAQAATLEPGDAIYMPPLWWHHVESLQQLNALVNYWWNSLPDEDRNPGDTLDALYHCILAFRALPASERANWQRLLQYYVFDENDPLPHVPEERRGVLGPSDAGVRKRLRRQARAHLGQDDPP